MTTVLGRYFGGQFGPWAMVYQAHEKSTGIMLSVSASGIALSGAIRGRGAVVGYTSSNNRFPFLERSWEFPRER